jgi:hypothetical protein
VIITASREAALSERLQQRVCAVIMKYHDFERGYYENFDEPSGRRITIEVDDSSAERAASELRCCGFVVMKEGQRW